MLGRFAKLLLTATSLAPLLIIWALVDKLHHEWRWPQAWAVGVALALIVINGLVLKSAKKSLSRISFQASSVRQKDSEIVAFILAYLLPLAQSPEKSYDLPILLIVILVLGVVIWTSNSYSFNPLMTLAGYHFYEVSHPNGITYLMLTKRDIHSARDIKEVIQLSNYLTLEA